MHAKDALLVQFVQQGAAAPRKSETLHRGKNSEVGSHVRGAPGERGKHVSG